MGAAQSGVRLYIKTSSESLDRLELVLSLQLQFYQTIACGTTLTYGKIHKGHYEPWLTQCIADLRATLNLPFSYDEAEVHKHAIHMASSGENFGISPFPVSLLDKLNMEPSVEDPSVVATESTYQTAALVTIKGSTSQAGGAQYRFLSSRQHTRYAVVPVHTQAEHVMFTFLLGRFPSHQTTGTINFDEFTRIWNSYADGVHIFYKTPEYLRSRYKLWEDLFNSERTRANNADEILRINSQLQLSTRKRSAPTAQSPRPLKVPAYEDALDTNAVSSISAVIGSSPEQQFATPLLPYDQRTSPSTARPSFSSRPAASSISRQAITATDFSFRINPSIHLAPKLSSPSSSSAISTNRQSFGAFLANIPKVGRKCSVCKQYGCPGNNKKQNCPKYGK
ncbi:hypothetical protein BJV82DRAFT_676588 [Fennellomyces sp. T-0311]|nr:hypothetical protein BJV82DRAFT_676588 [Fennellomyces sp. T-0311]